MKRNMEGPKEENKPAAVTEPVRFLKNNPDAIVRESKSGGVDLYGGNKIKKKKSRC